MSENIKTLNKPLQAFLLPFVVAIIAIAVYSDSLSYDFVYDDVSQVLKNPWITDLTHIPDMFSKSVWSFLSVPSVSNHYRPLMHVIYMINYHIFGLRPWGFHLVNVLFHAANSVLVFIIASNLLGRENYAVSGKQQGDESTQTHSGYSLLPASLFSPSFIAALLFAVHPVHTEAVAWVGAVTDLSFTFFSLLSLYFWIRHATGHGKRAYVYSLISFSLALLCKEPAATLPFLFLAYDASMGKSGRGLADYVKKYLPCILILGIYFAARHYALGGFAPVGAYREFTTYQLVINVFPLFTRYLELLVFPVRLNAFYVLHPLTSILTMKGMPSLFVTAGYLALTVIAFRKSKTVFFSLLLIAVPLLPAFYVPGLGEASLAERYLYLPSFGFVLLLAAMLLWINRKLPRYSALAVLIAFALAGMYSIQSMKRNPVWKDNLSLFSDMVRQSPEGELPRGMLGNALMKRGKIDEAIEQYRIVSTELNPNSPQAHRNLGLAFMEKGMKKEAIEEYEKAVALAPADFEARRGLVLAYEKAGLLDKEIEQYRVLLNLTPGSAETHYRLAGALSKKGLTKDALTHFQEALKINPDYVDAHYNLGSLYANSGQMDEAIGHFEAAVRLQPDNAFYRNILGITYGQKGLFDKALEQFEAAVRLAPGESAYRDNLERAKGLKRH